jgi:hypothetical protein
LQLARTYLFVCLADHNLPHPHPLSPLEGEEIIKLALVPLEGEGVSGENINRNAPAKRGALKPNQGMTTS